MRFWQGSSVQLALMQRINPFRKGALPFHAKEIKLNATEDLNVIRQRLEEELAMLLAQIADANQKLARPADRLPEWLDLAEAETEHELQMTLLARSQHQLEQVEAALQRLKSNQYGYCVVCGRASTLNA